MRCAECGAWLREDDRFCPRCGTAKPETVQPLRLPRPGREHPWVPLAYIVVLAIAVTIVGAASGAFDSPPLTQHQKDFRDYMECLTTKATPCPPKRRNTPDPG